MKRRLIVGVIACLFAVLGVTVFLQTRPTGTPAHVEAIFGGPKGIDLLRWSERIEAYRIDLLPAGIGAYEAVPSDYPVISGPVAVPPDAAEELRDVLTRPTSYEWHEEGDPVSACSYIPGIRLDFIQGEDRLQTLLCFHCDDLGNFVNGQTVGFGHFPFGRRKLVRVAQKLFPDDAVIQALEEDR